MYSLIRVYRVYVYRGWLSVLGFGARGWGLGRRVRFEYLRPAF